MRTILSVVAAFVLMAGQRASADSVIVTSSIRPISAVEANATNQPAPTGGLVFEFFVTTDSDILAINFVRTTVIGGDLYQNTFGTPGAPPNPAFIPTFPSLAADSFITTPGDTAVLGGGLPADGDDTYFDTTDDGPQNNFKFAQLTVSAGVGVDFLFEGQIDIAGTKGVFAQRFCLGYELTARCVPESGTMSLASLALLVLAAGRRAGDSIVSN